MNKTKAEFLFSTYRRFFKTDPKDLQKTLMGFGFEVDDGWFELVRECLERLSAIPEEIEIIQIKEKFGSLRVYLDGPSEAHQLSEEFSDRSAFVCESCGTPGETRNVHGWYSTLCEPHFRQLVRAKRNLRLVWATRSFSSSDIADFEKALEVFGRKGLGTVYLCGPMAGQDLAEDSEWCFGVPRLPEERLREIRRELRATLSRPSQLAVIASNSRLRRELKVKEELVSMIWSKKKNRHAYWD